MKNYSSFPYIDIIKNYKNSGDSFYDIGFKYAGPILFIYVWWVLLEAQKKNINRLYFIARDGYPLYEIAKIFVDKFNLNIECKYLYCSRKVLRLACYHVDRDTFKHILFKKPVNPTFDSLIDRFNLTNELINNLKAELNINHIKYDGILSDIEYTNLIKYLQNNKHFTEAINQTSADMFNMISNYLLEQDFFTFNYKAIVDLGWFGSIQYALKTILKYNNKNIVIEGFYFGLYYNDYQNETFYNTFIFNNKFDCLKIWFSPNLLECMCSAPYGQTIGYNLQNNKMTPIFSEQPTEINQQTKKINDGIFDFSEKMISIINYNIKAEILINYGKKLTKKMMQKPSNELYTLVSTLLHVDNFSGDYSKKIINNNDRYSLSLYTITGKLINKIIKKEFINHIYWVAGSMHNIAWYKKIYYICNMYIIYTFKELVYMLKRTFNAKNN